MSIVVYRLMGYGDFHCIPASESPLRPIGFQELRLKRSSILGTWAFPSGLNSSVPGKGSLDSYGVALLSLAPKLVLSFEVGKSKGHKN